MKNILFALFSAIKVKQEIRAIQKRRYNNYRGKKMKGLQATHSIIRKAIGDKKFLAYLIEVDKKNPRPKFNINEPS